MTEIQPDKDPIVWLNMVAGWIRSAQYDEDAALAAIEHGKTAVVNMESEHLSVVQQFEEKYRYQLWRNHGHGGISLYGDDGEMQCHECKQWDYKRGNLEELEHQSSIALAIFASKQMVIHEENQSKFQQLEQQIRRLREALQQIQQRTLADESHLWKNAALLVDAGDIKRIADAALKESEWDGNGNSWKWRFGRRTADCESKNAEAGNNYRRAERTTRRQGC